MSNKLSTSIVEYHQFSPEFMYKWDEPLQLSNMIYPLLLNDYADATKETINTYLKQFELDYRDENLCWKYPFKHPVSMHIQIDYYFILSFLQKLKKEKAEADAKKKKKENTVLISKDEYDDLMWELDGYPDIVKAIHKFYKIESLVELPKAELYNAKREIRRIKKNDEL